MKKINEKIRNLFKKEINIDTFKIILVLIIYLIIYGLAQAGLEYRKFSTIKEKQVTQKTPEYKYFLYVNGNETEYKSNELKNLFSLIDSINEIELDYKEFYEGKEIVRINKTNKFEILINGEKINSNFIPNSEFKLPNRTKIEILVPYY